MKATRVVCILGLLALLAVSVPAAADEGPGVSEGPVGDVLHFIPIVNNLRTGFEVMNLGVTQTYIDIWYYNAAGANVHTSTFMKINGLSSRTIYPLPAAAATAQSAVVVSYLVKTAAPPTSPDDDEHYTTYGFPIAVTVNRFGSAGEPAATYTGIGRPLLPADDADGNHYLGQDTYWIYAPVIHKENNTWNSTIWIQHAFLCDFYDVCEGAFPDADVDIYFYKPDGGQPVAFANLYIPAFASVALPSPVTLADGVYSAWIRGHSPICGVVDQYNSATLSDATGMFLSYRASPKNRWDLQSSSANFNFGPLIFSEYNGWDSGIALLNTSETQDADVVATFRAKDGTVLATVNQMLEERSDWILYPLSDLAGSISLPKDQIGSVSFEAQNFWPPGAPAPVRPDNAIVAVVNQINPTASMGSAYNAFRATFDPDLGDWAGLDTATFLAAPLMMKYNGSTTPSSGWSTGIVVMNTDLNDYTAERIELNFWDAAGGPVPVNSLRINLRGGTTHTIDMRYQMGNTIPPGWIGSCTVSSQFGLAFTWTPLAAVVNEIYDAPAGAAQAAGDLFMTYEAYPAAPMMVCYGDVDVHVYDSNTDEDVSGATVTVGGVSGPDTDGLGHSLVLNVPGGDKPYSVAKSGYWTATGTQTVVCEAETELDVPLFCSNFAISTTVLISPTLAPLEGATVEFDFADPNTGASVDWSGETNANGYFYKLGFPKDMIITKTVSKEGFSTRTFTNTFPTGSTYNCDVLDVKEETEPLESYAHIVGRVYCDGLISDNNIFDPGEEVKGAKVYLYNNGHTELLKQTESDDNGFYAFEVDIVKNNLVVNDFDILCGPVEENADDLLADESRCVDIRLECGGGGQGFPAGVFE